jgi:hypothetical protein
MIPTAMRAARISGIALSIKCFLLIKASNAIFDAKHLEKVSSSASVDPSGVILPIDGNDAGS